MPGSEHNFVSSHRSGCLYTWTTENHANTKITNPISYVSHKETLDARVCSVKQRTKCPLLSRWEVGHGPINGFAFSPNSVHIAVASQDGFLRIYDFHKQESYGRMRSYFGGLLCVCWSPDGKYVVTGGEDDLVTVWSFEHKKVVARGEGHKSYVNAVAFDPYMTVLPNADGAAKQGELVQTQAEASQATPSSDLETDSRVSLEAAGSPFPGGRHMPEPAPLNNYTAYRLGSIGQDTQLCLWDLSGDTLKLRRLLARGRSRMSRQSRPVSTAELGIEVTPTSKEALRGAAREGGSPQRGQGDNFSTGGGSGVGGKEPSVVSDHFGSDSNLNLGSNHTHLTGQSPELSLPVDLLRKESSPSVSVSSTSSVSSKKEKKQKRKKDKPKKDKPLKHHRSTLKDPMRKVIKFVGSGFSSSNSSTNHTRRSVGTFESCNSDDIAPKMHEVNLVEPLVAKKISQERLTALVFREDCILTACQEGFISTWARPTICINMEEGEEGEGRAVKSPDEDTPSMAASNPGVSLISANSITILAPEITLKT